MRRPFLIVSVPWMAGITAGGWLPGGAWVLLGLSLFLAGWCLLNERARGGWLPFLLLFLAGWTHYAMRVAPLAPEDLRRVFGASVEYVTVQGRLARTPVPRSHERLGRTSWRCLAELDVSRIERGEARWEPAAGRVLVRTPALLGPAFHGGREVAVTGVLRQPRPAVADGLFDYRIHLAHRGIHYQLDTQKAEDWVELGTSRFGPPLTDRFQAWARAALARGLPEQDEALELLWAMVLGWRSGLTDEVAEPFMRSGTMHLFAISGLHIGLIAIMLVGIFRVLQLPRAGSGLCALPLLWFFVVATGAQPSAVRAAVMFSILIGGWALRRPGDLLNSLGGTAFLVLLWDPRQLFQAGFQLSFFVVLSLAVLVPRLEAVRDRWLQPDPLLPAELRAWWRRRLDRAIRWLTSSLAVSLAAWLGALPWVAAYFHLITPVSLVANLLVVNLGALALCSCLASLGCALWAPGLSACFNHGAWFWMKGMADASAWFADWPGAWFHVPEPGAALILVYYLGLIGAATGWIFRPANRRRVGWGGLALVLAGLGVGLGSGGTTTVSVLALSGGDAIYVDAPGRRHDLLIDTGDREAAEFVVEPFLASGGVNQLNALLITHGDIRHVGGAEQIQGAFNPRETITSPIRFRSPDYRRLADRLEADAASWRQVARGDRVGCWRVLHPDRADRFSRADDSALVLLGQFRGTRVLLCSDLGRLGQQTLLEREPDLRAEIVVCGLPAQQEPLADLFLDAVQPQAIILTAGEYPASERASRALRARLGQRGIPVFYCVDDGTVTLKLGRKGWQLSGSRSRLRVERPARERATPNLERNR